MIDQLLKILKDPTKRSYPLAVLFLAFIVLSAYFLYTLPHDLVYKGSMTDHGLATGVYIKLYVMLGITFLFGAAAIYSAIHSKKEVIVYQERSNEDIKTRANEAGEQSNEALDVTSFRTAIVGINNESERLQKALHLVCKTLEAGQGALYKTNTSDGKRLLELKAQFALTLGESETLQFEFGEGLVGQSAASGTSLYIDEVPEGYINIVSGLGNAQPKYLFLTPIKKGEVLGVIEVATFAPLTEKVRKQAEEMALIIAESLTGK